MLDVIFLIVDTLQTISYFKETEWSHSIPFCLQENWFLKLSTVLVLLKLVESIMLVDSMAWKLVGWETIAFKSSST